MVQDEGERMTKIAKINNIGEANTLFAMMEDARQTDLIKSIADCEQKQTYAIDEVMNSVILGDALKVLKKLPEEVFDMVFIDPPYFLQLPKKELKRWTVKTVVEGVDDEWDKFPSFEAYDRFIGELLTQVKRVMKPSATIWVIATYHSIFRIGKLMQDLGYWILNDVIWVKTNPMPNWLSVRFTNATETLIWAVKDKNAKKYVFNKEQAKQFGIGKVGANVWVLPLCNGKERLKDEMGRKVHSTSETHRAAEADNSYLHSGGCFDLRPCSWSWYYGIRC